MPSSNQLSRQVLIIAAPLFRKARRRRESLQICEQRIHTLIQRGALMRHLAREGVAQTIAYLAAAILEDDKMRNLILAPDSLRL